MSVREVPANQGQAAPARPTLQELQSQADPDRLKQWLKATPGVTVARDLVPRLQAARGGT